ncbi:MAG: DNA topoisomerase IB [Candidatus Binatia bacterium]
MSDRAPGVRRARAGKGFVYFNARGRRVRRASELARFRAIVIPPAWTDVWICPSPDGHIQAVGRDARGRKQYRYHVEWRRRRDRTKFDRIVELARRWPAMRRRLRRDLARPGLPREKVLAAVVRILEGTQIRIGNREYQRANGSFGATTLRNRHVEVTGGRLRFRFIGKGGKLHEVELLDAKLARIVRRCQELAGQELFQYVDDDGRVQTIGSSDVNAYLKEIGGEEFTAKDFRIWAATARVAKRLERCGPARTRSIAERNVAAALAEVAAELGNTPIVCRKHYVHPSVIDAYVSSRKKKRPPVRGPR